ncbi:MAG: EAL domain-containing protein [Bacteroidales bacterium]|nr:EAL domain-containing protein [Bacteroidales bacterium]MCM1416279.1 EAL domain-containing protein [bacterium]MCM1423476.1 EAL domain-containing protein [bacterium]
MGKSLSYDIAAILILTVLLLSCVVRKLTNGTPNRLFLLFISVNWIAALFDIWAVSLDNAGSTSRFALYLAHSGYLIVHNFTVPVYVLFLISLTDTWHKIRRNFLIQLILWVPFLAVFVSLLANPFTKKMFLVDGGYQRGEWFSLIYMTIAVYIVFGVTYMIWYRKVVEFSKVCAVMSYIPIGLVTMLIQMKSPTTLVEMFGAAISMLLISVGAQRPEKIVDSDTQLMKYSAYATDMKRNYYNKKNVDVVMLNLGNFSAINALMGYDFAMQVLADVVERIHRANMITGGKADLYYLDRGRFRMVFEEKDRELAKQTADMLVDILMEKRDYNDLDVTLQPFVVLARCPEEIKDFKMLMTFGMDFHEKLKFEPRVMHVEDAFHKGLVEIQGNIDEIIEEALEFKRFQVYYQPIYSVEKGKFVSAEALLRLFDPKYGFISPEILVTAAERSGAIHRIGDYVLEEVCRFISEGEFHSLGLEYIEVNLSVAQCMRVNLADKILGIMAKHRVSAEYINLEITETAASHTQEVMAENLQKLNRAGISLSLDDYGTGYSNIKRVIQLPLKIIKLDKTFVDEQENPKMRVVLKNTVAMLKDMNMEIVVEGIETQEMLDFFAELQCDFIQGYFFSKPIPKPEFINFIKERAAE